MLPFKVKPIYLSFSYLIYWVVNGTKRTFGYIAKS